MDITRLTLTKRNFLYRGPADSEKFADFLEEVHENLSNFMNDYNDLYSLIQDLSIANLDQGSASGYLHPSGFIVPLASGYLSYNSINIQSIDSDFQAHLTNEFSSM